ncbi:MAG TPA: type II toxin-antitoxin system HicA family toxin [Bacteroidia bacterium]|nr:type II toxin-antitoxin system HicA family toxin [Bacteroidia bacterium]
MSSKLKLCSGAEAIKKFQRKGWKIARQKGSHVMLVKTGYAYTIAVPLHKELGIGLLRKLLQQAQISIEEFNEL